MPTQTEQETNSFTDTTRTHLQDKTITPGAINIAQDGFEENPLEPKEALFASVKIKHDGDTLDQLAVNFSYCVWFTIFWGFGTWHCTFALAGNTNTTPVFEAKFGWSADEALLYNSIISTAGTVGSLIGSFLGGSLLKFGRRRAAIIGHIVAILGCAVCMVPHTATLSLGRVLLGIAGGIENVIFGKMITETIPDRYISTFAMAHNASLCFGLFVCFSLGFILPDPKDFEANVHDELWRVIYGFPAIVALIEIVLILTVFTLEPTAACVMSGDEAAGLAHMRRVYRKKDPNSEASLDSLLSVHMAFTRRSTTLDAASTGFKAAVCGRKYRKATWVCVLLNVFN